MGFTIIFGIPEDVVQVHVHSVVFAELGPEIRLPLPRRAPFRKLVGPVVRFPATHTHTHKTKFLTDAKILHDTQNFSHMQKFYIIH